MNKFAIACMMYLAVVSMASAGYTDSLWNESEERIYYDCGDWSGVDNHKDLRLEGYGWGFDDDGNNRGRAYQPHRYGLPSDIRFVDAKNPHGGGVIDNIWWIFIYVRGFDKTLNYGGEVYTDDPTKINYIRGYLKVCGRKTPPAWNSVKIWSTVENMISDYEYTQKTTISIKYKAVDCDMDGCVNIYKTCSNTLSEKIEYEQWGDINQSVSIGLMNHSNYVILNVPTPDNITGIKISIESENVSAIYEKHTHCLKLNTSKPFMTYDLVECEYHNFTEIIPFGPDSYLLQYEPDYDINVTLYTPFETIDAIVTLNETNAEPINTDLKWDSIWDLLYIAVPISLILWLVGSI